MTVMNK